MSSLRLLGLLAAVFPASGFAAGLGLAYQLTHSVNADPTFSPDGKRIAFASNRYSSYQIFVMNADGSQVQLVANTEGRATAPKWSRDGKSIYFPLSRKVDYGSDCQIFVAPVPPLR